MHRNRHGLSCSTRLDRIWLSPIQNSSHKILSGNEIDFLGYSLICQTHRHSTVDMWSPFSGEDLLFHSRSSLIIIWFYGFQQTHHSIYIRASSSDGNSNNSGTNNENSHICLHIVSCAHESIRKTTLLSKFIVEINEQMKPLLTDYFCHNFACRSVATIPFKFRIFACSIENHIFLHTIFRVDCRERVQSVFE